MAAETSGGETRTGCCGVQAMDRAHRLGQTRPVTVYRLTMRGTIEEKVLKRAAQKNTVQQLVMTGQRDTSAGDLFSPDEVVSLLLDDDNLEEQFAQQQKAAAAAGVEGNGASQHHIAIRMADDEDVDKLKEEEVSTVGRAHIYSTSTCR
jgi:hypothetical protein